MMMSIIKGRNKIHLQLASQRLQECAKICVNECEYAKKRFAIFSDVCFFFF